MCRACVFTSQPSGGFAASLNRWRWLFGVRIARRDDEMRGFDLETLVQRWRGLSGVLSGHGRCLNGLRVAAAPVEALLSRPIGFNSSTARGPSRANGVLSLLLLGALILTQPQLALAAPDVAAKPPSLRIDSPFASPLWRADIDPTETYVVTGSAYKAATVWPLPDLTVRQTLRVPIRAEQRKRAHAVAISPDAAVVAMAVPPLADPNGLPRAGTGRIYLVDRVTGAIGRIIEGLPTRPQEMRFSPDGTALAVVLSDGCGVRLFARDDGRLMFQDDEGYAGEGADNRHCAAAVPATTGVNVDRLPDTFGVAFARGAERERNGSIWFVTSGVTGLRAYGRGDGQAVERVAVARPDALGIEQPADVVFSPDGDQLLVADRRDRKLQGPVRLRAVLVSPDTLAPIGRTIEITRDHLESGGALDTRQARHFAIEQVAWVRSDADPDEAFIYVGGIIPCQAIAPSLIRGATDAERRGQLCIGRFSVDEDDDEVAFFPVGTDSVMELIGMPKRGGVFYAGQRRVGLIDFEGLPIALDGQGATLEAQNRAIDFRGGNGTFRISDDGTTVQFRDYADRRAEGGTITFDLEKLELSIGDEAASRLSAPGRDDNIIRGWRNRQRPPEIIGQRPDALKSIFGDIYRSVSVDVENRRLLLGSSDYIRVISWGRGGVRISCETRIEFEAYRVNLTPDGRLAVVGHSDGTLRWYSIDPIEGVPAGGGDADQGDDGRSCVLRERAAVHVRRLEDGTWVWSAWLPSGAFANHSRAQNIFGWQVEDPDGQVSFVPWNTRIDLYDPAAVKKALQVAATDDASTSPPAAPGSVTTRVVSTPAETRRRLVALNFLKGFEKIDTETVDFRLAFIDATRPDQIRLTAKTGSGVNMPIVFQGRRLEPGEPLVVEQPRRFELTVELPASVRRTNRIFQVCFYLDAELDHCDSLRWVGPLAPRPKRDLYAIIVGVSDYDHDSLDLESAHNDAIDLATLFVNDYEGRGPGSPGGRTRDYEHIHLDLVVAVPPDRTAARAERDALAAHDDVTVRPATRNGVLAALDDLVALDREEALSNDLVVFYFAGHGYVHPTNRTSGRSLFLTRETDPRLRPETLATTAITSADILDRLSQISGEKLAIFDACRVPSSTSVVPLDPWLVNAEFSGRVLSAHYFFSGIVGQYSLDQKDFVFNTARPSSEQGNGLFTYALLKALTDPAADSEMTELRYRNSIEVVEARDYISVLFDLDREDSPASILRRKRRLNDIQQPFYIKARQAGSTDVENQRSVLRTLDVE